LWVSLPGREERSGRRDVRKNRRLKHVSKYVSSRKNSGKKNSPIKGNGKIQKIDGAGNVAKRD